MDELKDVIARVQRARTYVEDWHKNIVRWRKLYDMQHYDKPGKPGEVRYSDPTYTNTVDLAVGIMLGNDLRWHAYGFSPSAEEQARTGKMEKLVAGMLEINNERDEMHHMYRLFLNFDRDGGGVIYSVFDPEIAERVKTTKEVPSGEDESGVEVKYKFSEVPIRMQTIDPLKVFCLPGGPKRWLMIGREEQRTVLDIETTYGVTLPKYSHLSQDDKAQTKGNMIDAWDFVWVGKEAKVRRTVLFDLMPVKGPDIMPGYEDLPYTLQFFKPTGDSSETWQSILSPLETSVALLERSFNRRAHQIDVFTALPLITKSQPGRPVQVDPGLYNHISIAPDESVEFASWPGNAPDVQQHLDFLRSRVQQSGFSDVMFGSGQNQVAGYALSQLGDQNRIRLEQPIKHMELLLTIWAKKAMRLLKTFASDTLICVYGRLKGEDYVEDVDINELSGYSIRAEIRPNFPNEESRKVAMSTQVKGMLSDYTNMERFLGVEQPEDEQKRKIIEATTNHPVALQYAIMAELKARADEGDEIAAMTLQQIQSGGMPGEPGRPKEPNNPEQPMGLQSPTGLPPGQSAIEQQDNMANEAPQMTE